jgi:hypothetical protein
MDTQVQKKSFAVTTWIVIILLALFILFKGALSFLVVGDMGQPDWAFRPVPDVPGESPYAIYEPLPFPQHVKGAEGE